MAKKFSRKELIVGQSFIYKGYEGSIVVNKDSIKIDGLVLNSYLELQEFAKALSMAQKDNIMLKGMASENKLAN